MKPMISRLTMMIMTPALLVILAKGDPEADSMETRDYSLISHTLQSISNSSLFQKLLGNFDGNKKISLHSLKQNQRAESKSLISYTLQSILNSYLFQKLHGNFDGNKKISLHSLKQNQRANQQLLLKLSEQVDTLSSRVDINEEAIELINKKVQDLSDRVTQNEENLGTLTIQVTQNEEDLGTLTIQVTQNEEDMGNLQTQVTQNEEDMGNLQTQVTQNEEGMGNLQTQVTQNDGDIVNLQTQITQNEQNMGNLQTQLVQTLENLQDNINQLEETQKCGELPGTSLIQEDCVIYYPAGGLGHTQAAAACVALNGRLWTPNFDDPELFNSVFKKFPNARNAEFGHIWIGAKIENGVALDMDRNDISGEPLIRDLGLNEVSKCVYLNVGSPGLGKHDCSGSPEEHFCAFNMDG